MDKLQNLFSNFLESIGGVLPGVLGAIITLIVGWFIAGMLRRLTHSALKKTNLDNRLLRGTVSKVSPERLISKLVYYLIMTIVLLIVLDMLGVGSVLDPLKDMVGKFMGYIPNIIGAGIIGFAGYMIATIVSEVVSFAGEGIESFGAKMGLSASVDLSKILKTLVFVIVFIPILIVALDTLKLDAISGPAKEMLGSFLNAIPNILGAAIIIGVFFIAGKFLSSIGGDLLRGLGTDQLVSRLGLGNIIGQNTSLSTLIVNVGFFFLMFTGVIAAVEKLNFPALSVILTNIFEMVGGIFFGMIILAIGNYISNIAYNALAKTGDNNFMATIAKVATLGLFLAIALRTMGIANDIINLAFGLTLGAIAVAFALSFGLGGREAAGKQMEHFLKKFRNEA